VCEKGKGSPTRRHRRQESGSGKTHPVGKQEVALPGGGEVFVKIRETLPTPPEGKKIHARRPLPAVPSRRTKKAPKRGDAKQR
jgi:hypothetical protein